MQSGSRTYTHQAAASETMPAGQEARGFGDSGGFEGPQIRPCIRLDPPPPSPVPAVGEFNKFFTFYDKLLQFILTLKLV